MTPRANTVLLDALSNQHTTSPFGAPRPVGTHQGRDSRASQGTEFFAAGYGYVSMISTKDPVYGYCIKVTYKMVDGRRVTILYGHLYRINVKITEEVTPSTVLGLTGGRPGHPGAGVSTWDHLHEGMWVNDILSNPDNLLTNRTTAGSGGTAVPGTIQGEIMRTLRHPNGVITAVGETTYQHLTPGTVVGEIPYVQVTAAEYDNAIVNTQIRLTYQLNAQINALSPLLGTPPAATVDIAAIAAKVEANLADDFARLESQIADLDAAVGITTNDVVTALQPQFDAVNANIDNQPTEFTVSPKE